MHGANQALGKVEYCLEYRDKEGNDKRKDLQQKVKDERQDVVERLHIKSLA